MSKSRGNTCIYSGQIARRIFMQPGRDLPARQSGRFAAMEFNESSYDSVFMPGIRMYSFGAPKLLEAGILPFAPDDRIKSSDYICIGQAYEQPSVYRTYYGDTFKKDYPVIDRNTANELLKALDSAEFAIPDKDKNKELRGMIEKMADKSSLFPNVWREIQKHPDRYDELRALMIDAEFRFTMERANKVFTEAGAANIREIKFVIDNVHDRLNENLNILPAQKLIMHDQLDKLYDHCVQRAPVENGGMLTAADWNEGMRNIDRLALGLDATTFTNMIAQELSDIHWRDATPSIIYHSKEDMKEYFNRLNETTPPYMHEVNERLYKELMSYIEKDQKEGPYLHTPEEPYKPLTQEEINADEGRMRDFAISPVIINTLTCSNEQADKHEVFITCFDGQSYTCDKIIGDTDGGISQAQANTPLSMAVTEIDRAADMDVIRETADEQHQEQQEADNVRNVTTETEITTEHPDGRTTTDRTTSYEMEL